MLVMLVLMLVFAARHAVTPRGSLASGVVDADAVPEERVHRARAEVPGCVLHRRRAHRVQETAEPETLSSFSALALLAAADRRGLAPVARESETGRLARGFPPRADTAGSAALDPALRLGAFFVSARRALRVERQAAAAPRRALAAKAPLRLRPRRGERVVRIGSSVLAR